MIVYRFTKQVFSHDISGEGSKKWGGRWNSPGLAVVYTSGVISLSLLELLIYQSSYEEIVINHLMRIKVPENVYQSLSTSSLKAGWQHDIEYCRFIGNEFLQNKNALMLKVPSAIIPEEHNFLINPLHPDFEKCSLVSSGLFEFDTRLFK
jgi:RES domain-containing protein